MLFDAVLCCGMGHHRPFLVAAFALLLVDAWSAPASACNEGIPPTNCTRAYLRLGEPWVPANFADQELVLEAVYVDADGQTSPVEDETIWQPDEPVRLYYWPSPEDEATETSFTLGDADPGRPGTRHVLLDDPAVGLYDFSGAFGTCGGGMASLFGLVDPAPVPSGTVGTLSAIWVPSAHSYLSDCGDADVPWGKLLLTVPLDDSWGPWSGAIESVLIINGERFAIPRSVLRREPTVHFEKELWAGCEPSARFDHWPVLPEGDVTLSLEITVAGQVVTTSDTDVHISCIRPPAHADDEAGGCRCVPGGTTPAAGLLGAFWVVWSGRRRRRLRG